MTKKKSIKEELLQYITNLRPNERIPSRNFICTKWHVSRSTADAIISELQGEGVVYCVKGKGTFVSQRKETDAPGADAKNCRWAILCPDLTFGLYPKAFRGIATFAWAHNIDFAVYCTDESADTEYALIQRAVHSGIEGFIIIPIINAAENERNYRYLSKTGIPFVFWQRSADYMSEIPQFLLNGYYGGYIAARHLINSGYRRVAYLAPKYFRSSVDRYMGYCAAFADAGLEVDPELVRIGIRPEEVHDCVCGMLTGDHPADGFVCFVDTLAAEVVAAVRGCGLRVSDDVGVIGFEGNISMLDAELDISLTYVDINYEESGKAAAQSLWDCTHNKEVRTNQSSVFTPRLVIRNSCLGKNGSV